MRVRRPIKTNVMKFSVEKLKKIAKPLPEESRAELMYRDENREFLALSEKFALKVRYLLRRKGLTQAELAEKMGVTPTQISKMLSGKENIQLKTIAKLQLALDTSLIDFSIEEEEETFYKLVDKYITRMPSTNRLMPQALTQVEAAERTTLNLNEYCQDIVISLS